MFWLPFLPEELLCITPPPRESNTAGKTYCVRALPAQLSGMLLSSSICAPILFIVVALIHMVLCGLKARWILSSLRFWSCSQCYSMQNSNHGCVILTFQHGFIAVALNSLLLYTCHRFQMLSCNNAVAVMLLHDRYGVKSCGSDNSMLFCIVITLWNDCGIFATRCGGGGLLHRRLPARGVVLRNSDRTGSGALSRRASCWFNSSLSCGFYGARGSALLPFTENARKRRPREGCLLLPAATARICPFAHHARPRIIKLYQTRLQLDRRLYMVLVVVLSSADTVIRCRSLPENHSAIYGSICTFCFICFWTSVAASSSRACWIVYRCRVPGDRF